MLRMIFNASVVSVRCDAGTGNAPATGGGAGAGCDVAAGLPAAAPAYAVGRCAVAR